MSENIANFSEKDKTFKTITKNKFIDFNFIEFIEFYI